MKDRHYSDVRKKFLKENPIDVVGVFVFGKFQPSTIVHHSKSRGKNLTDTDTFIATTHEGDKWIHTHFNLAKELGFIYDICQNSSFAPRKPAWRMYQQHKIGRCEICNTWTLRVKYIVLTNKIHICRECCEKLNNIEYNERCSSVEELKKLLNYPEDRTPKDWT